MKVKKVFEFVKTLTEAAVSLTVLILTACEGGSNSSTLPQVTTSGDSPGKVDSHLPPLHSPTTSILKDPRLIWDRQGAILPDIGMGYRPDNQWMPAGYTCFVWEPHFEETNISESGYHFHASRSKDSNSFSFSVTGVHVTREWYVSKLVWDEAHRSWLLTPKEQGGLGISFQELNSSCSMGVLATLFGQHATLGFQANLNESEVTPPATDLYFEDTPEGRAKLSKTSQPYLEWSSNKTGQSFGQMSPMVDLQLDPGQDNNIAATVIAYIDEAKKKAETDQKFRDGESLSGFLLVDRAPSHE